MYLRSSAETTERDFFCNSIRGVFHSALRAQTSDWHPAVPARPSESSSRGELPCPVSYWIRGRNEWLLTAGKQEWPVEGDGGGGKGGIFFIDNIQRSGQRRFIHSLPLQGTQLIDSLTGPGSNDWIITRFIHNSLALAVFTVALQKHWLRAHTGTQAVHGLCLAVESTDYQRCQVNFLTSATCGRCS